MKFIYLASILAAAYLAATPARAHTGVIAFTAEERAFHEANIETIVTNAAACLQHDIAYHQSFFQQHGISPYYGDRSSFGKLSYAGKKDFLRQMGFNGNLVTKLEPTSCVGLSLKCLGAGFRAAGQEQIWLRIRAYVNENGVDGTALQAALQLLGWKILYWNPDARLNATWDRAEREKNPTNSDRFWGYHQENWRNVSRNGRYLYNTVDDRQLFVNFGATTPPLLREVPFFVGTAHMGYHVFPGTFGLVVEAHSTRQLTDPKTLQSAMFNPLAGGAPTDGEYFTGLIAIPGKYFH